MVLPESEGSNQIITKHQHLSLRAHEFLPVVDRYTVPFLVEPRAGRFDQRGSGIAVQKDGRCYLLTAEHVVSRIFDEGLDVFIADNETGGTGKVYKLPSGTRSEWRFHENDKLDLALLPFDRGFGNFRFFPLDQITRGHLPAMRGLYFLAGYPNSRNKARDVNPPGGEKRSGIASIIVSVDQTLDFESDGKNPTEYLGFRYEAVYEDGEWKQQGISLRGLSGCGLWYFPNEDVNSPHLAGIFIEHHRSKIGYASFAKFVNALI